MLKLLKIRSGREDDFEPYIPIRWRIKFNNPKLNIVDHQFPAKKVTFTGLHYNDMDIQLAPGISIKVNTMFQPVTKIQIEFYDNSKRDIYNTIKDINRSLEIGQSLSLTSNQLTVTIDNYDKDLVTILNTWTYQVQIAGNYINNLQQEAVAYLAPLDLNVIG